MTNKFPGFNGSDPGPCGSIPDSLKTMAEAHSVQIQSTDRKWFFLATLSLYALIAQPNDASSQLQFLAIGVSPKVFYQSAVVLLSVTYVAFTSSALNANRGARMLHDHLVYIKATARHMGGIWTLKDVAHMLPRSGVNRMFPLTLYVRSRKKQKWIYLTTKFLSAAVYYTLPVGGICVALGHLWPSVLYMLGSAMLVIPSYLLLWKMELERLAMRREDFLPGAPPSKWVSNAKNPISPPNNSK